MQPVFRNRLIRRVQRHSSLGVMFRSSDGSAPAPRPSASAVQYPGPAANPSIVKASLSKPAPAAFPLPFVQPAQPRPIPARQSPQPLVIPPAIRSTPTEIRPTSPIINQALSPIKAQEGKSSEPDDKSWHLLQNIFRKHQELETSSDQQEEAPVFPNTPEMPVAQQDLSVVKTEPTVGTTVPTPAQTPHAQALNSEYFDQADEQPVEFPQSIQNDQQEAESLPSFENYIAPEQPSEEIDLPLNQPPLQTTGKENIPDENRTIGSKPEAVIEKTLAELETIPDKVIPKQEISSDKAVVGQEKTVDKAVLRQEVTANNSVAEQQPFAEQTIQDIRTVIDPQISEQQTPLEAIWPVERRKPDLPTSEPPFIPQVASQPGLPAPQEKRLRQVMQSFNSDQPTDSSVEIITPRQPRPAPAIPSVQPVIQRSMEEPTEQPLAVSQSKPKEQSTLVQTEIGDLPSDLWTLIGQKAPSSPQSKEIPAVAVESVRPRPLAIEAPKSERQEKASTPESIHIQPLLHSEPLGSRAIQMSPENDSTSEVIQASTEPGSPAQTEQQQQPQQAGQAGAEPNVEELAQKVYADIKRRLSVEWERLRQRF